MMANFLQQLRDRMARKSRRFVGIDFDSRRVHIIFAQRGLSGPEFLRFHTVDIPAEVSVADPLSFGPFLHKAMAKLHLASHPVLMNIPRSQAVLKPLTLPAGTATNEIASMVRFQVDKELPFRVEDAVIDYTLAGGHFGAEQSNAADGLHVLVAATRLPAVDYYRRLAQASGLQLLRLGLRPNADARCVLACNRDDSGDSIAFVHVNFDEIEIGVLTGETLAFTRSVSVKGPAAATAANAPLPLAGNEPKTAAENLQATLSTLTGGAGSGAGVSPACPEGILPSHDDKPGLTALLQKAGETPARREGETPSPQASVAAVEISRSLQSFQALQRTGRIGTILIAGDTGIEESLVQDLGQRLKVRCELLATSAILEKKHAGVGGAYAAAMGLAIGQSHDNFTFDFLNPKQPIAPRDARKVRIAAALAAAAIVLIALLCANASYLNGKASEYATAANLEKSQKEEADKLAALAEQARNLESWTQSRQDWLAHLAYISEILPDAKSVYIQNLTITPTGGDASPKKGAKPGHTPVATIKFSLRSRERETITSLTERLVDADYQFTPSNIDPCRDEYGYANETRVTLTVPMDMNDLKPPQLGERTLRPQDDASAEMFGRKPLAIVTPSTPERGGASSSNPEQPKVDYKDVKFDDLKRGSDMLASLSGTPVVLAGRMSKEDSPKYLVEKVTADSHVCYRMEEMMRGGGGQRRFVYCYVPKDSKTMEDIDRRGPRGLRFARVEGRAYFTGQEPADCPVGIVVERLR